MLNNNRDSPVHILRRGPGTRIDLVYQIPKHLLHVRNKDNETIFHLACVNRHNFSTIVLHLVKSMTLIAGNISKIIGSDATALHFACIAGDLDAVQLLVDCDPLAQITDTALLKIGKCVTLLFMLLVVIHTYKSKNCHIPFDN